MRKLIIGVDFDGTVAQENRESLIEPGEPVPGALEALRRLKEEGHTLVLWTCRDGRWLEAARRWLERHGVVVDAFNEQLASFDTSRKIYCDVYVDDRGIAFLNEPYVDWERALAAIRRFAEAGDELKPTLEEYTEPA